MLGDIPSTRLADGLEPVAGDPARLGAQDGVGGCRNESAGDDRDRLAGSRVAARDDAPRRFAAHRPAVHRRRRVVRQRDRRAHVLGEHAADRPVERHEFGDRIGRRVGGTGAGIAPVEASSHGDASRRTRSSASRAAASASAPPAAATPAA